MPKARYNDGEFLRWRIRIIDQSNLIMRQLPAQRFNPLDPDVLADPYPYYRWMREHDCVHWGAASDSEADGCWYITRYEHAEAILKDQRFGRDIWRIMPDAQTDGESGEIQLVSQQWMVLRDPPAHTRLRQLVQRVFTPRMIARLQPRIFEIAGSLLTQAQHKGEIELISDYSLPLAVIVIAEMLGVLPEDRDRFLPLTKALAAVIEFEQNDQVREQGRHAIAELNDYLRAIIRQRRQQPQDDLISALLIPTNDDSVPSEDELLGTCTQLLFGGNDPIAHMIGNGMLALLRHPEEMRRWRADPELFETALEEIMRYDSSVQMTFRYALEDISFAGKNIRQGDQIAIVFGSANRDPEQFSDPDRFNLSRTPNRHLSLGMGIHFCMGAALGRLEGQVAFNLLLKRFPEMELQSDPLEWNQTVAVRGLKCLRLKI